MPLVLALVVSAILVAGCASADADRSDPDGTAPQAAMLEPARSSPTPDVAPRAATPDLLGADIEEVRTALAEAGAAGLHVLAFDRDGPVTAQYPEAAAPMPGDDPVLVWLGSPPEPPRPAPPVPAPEPAAEDPDGDDASEPADTPVAEPPDEPEQPSTRPETTEESADPPEPPASADADAARSQARTSPQDLPASGAGTTLSGAASWYGAGFAGRTTACGGRFDPAAVTFASRELRCGTIARVTGPAGSVKATATDWGPAAWTNRRFDLSQATFAAVAPLSRGVVEVTVEVLE